MAKRIPAYRKFLKTKTTKEISVKLGIHPETARCYRNGTQRPGDKQKRAIVKWAKKAFDFNTFF